MCAASPGLAAPFFPFSAQFRPRYLFSNPAPTCWVSFVAVLLPCFAHSKFANLQVSLTEPRNGVSHTASLRWSPLDRICHRYPNGAMVRARVSTASVMPKIRENYWVLSCWAVCVDSARFSYTYISLLCCRAPPIMALPVQLWQRQYLWSGNVISCNVSIEQ